MFSREQLVIRLETIFKREESDMVENNFKPLIYLDAKRNKMPFVGSIPEDKIFLDVPNWHEVYKNLDLLRKLYSMISSNQSLRECFLEWIQNHIENDDINLSTREGTHVSINKSTSSLAFRFLFRIKMLDLTEVALDKRHKNKLKSDNIYEAIKSILTFEHYLMNEGDLELIERITRKMFFRRVRLIDDYEAFEHNKKVRIINSLINDIRFHRLEKELNENFNFEINQDKEKVQQFIKRYGFDEDSASALDKIDESFFDSSEESFDLRNNISLLKEVFDSVTESVLNQIIELTDENPTQKHEKEHPTETKHRFICEKIEFTEGESKSMSSVNKMLNEEKHSLISKKEKFRLVRNFTIEFILLMFTKLAQLKGLNNCESSV